MNNLKVERNKLYFERKYYYYLLWHGTEKPNEMMVLNKSGNSETTTIQ